ncbi:hypothetical protein PENSPDRAFT_693156 [Peniophora sp. CONT]|nr:hypothetical protein PENSPDRAFT_693156 [Peniophora sp. CONT]
MLGYVERSSISGERAALTEQLTRDADVLKRMLSETHSRINALTPIYRLPPEVLMEVFSTLAEVEPPYIHYHIRTLGWIHVTHVCRTWRALCLRHTSLWARSIGRLPRALPTFLERAGDHVRLHFHLQEGWSNFAYTKTENHSLRTATVGSELASRASRIKTLQWHADSGIEASIIGSTLYSRQFDVLEELYVNLPRIIWSSANMAVSDVKLRLRATALRVLVFTRFFVWFSAPQLTSLTLQKLECPIRTILQIALECPLLESLYLAFLENLRIEDETTSHSSVRLLHLEHLDLDLAISGREMVDLIACLDVPRETRIRIRLVTLLEAQDYLLFDKLVKMTTSQDEESSIQLIASSLSMTTPRRPGTPWRVKWMVAFEDMSDLFYHLPSTSFGHHLQRVTHLAIIPDNHSTADDWERVFHLFPRVHTLEFCNHDRETSTLYSDHEVFDALSRCFDKQGHPYSHPPLPELLTLSLSPDVPPETIWLENTVVECLRTRAFANARPVHSLSMTSLNEEPEVTRALRDHRRKDQTFWKTFRPIGGDF